MEAFRSFSSRLLVTQDKEEDKDFSQDVSTDDREWVQKHCESINEWDDAVYMLWIKKIKKQEYKQQKRLFVITRHRIFSARKSKHQYDVRREGHILDMEKVHEQGLSITIKHRAFSVQFTVNDDTTALQIINTLYANYSMSDPGFPSKLVCQWLDQYNSSQAAELAKRVPTRVHELGKWDRPVRAFKSYCSFYGMDAEKMSNGLRAMLARPLGPEEEERWIRSSDLSITHSKVLAGLVMSVAFTPMLVHGLDLSDCKGDGYLYDTLRILLRHNRTLKSLVLDGVTSSPEWGNLLFDGLNQNQGSGLIRFGMKNARITEKGVEQWISGNKKLARQPECIYLTHSGGSSKQIVKLISSFVGKSEYGNGLTELDLSENPLESRGTQCLANRIVKDFSDLKVLKLAKCAVDAPRLLNALEAAQQQKAVALEELDISYNKMTQQDGLILARILSTAGTTASLSIAGCGLTGSTVAALCASLLVNEKLQFYVRVDASHNSIGCDGAIMIASVFIQLDRIMQVKLNNCDLTHEGMGYILKSLENQPRLRILELDNNCKREEWNSGKYHVNQGLRSLLERALVLESLSLKNDPENGYQCDLDHFLYALKTNGNLLSLDISGNSMTNDNLQALKDVVIKNIVLRELHWDNNNITSRHIIGLTHALKQNRSLQLVEFPEHDFQKEMARVQKDKGGQAKVMELQVIRKKFFQALFENNTLAGFEAAPIAIQRKAAKRNSILPVHRDMGQVPYGKNPAGGRPPPAGPLGLLPQAELMEADDSSEDSD